MEKSERTPEIEKFKPVKSDFDLRFIGETYKNQGFEDYRNMAKKDRDEYAKDFYDFERYYQGKIGTLEQIEIFEDHAKYLTVAGFHKYHSLMDLQASLNSPGMAGKDVIKKRLEDMQSNFTYWRLQGVYELVDEAFETGVTSWQVKLESALGRPHELDYDTASIAFSGTSQSPEQLAVFEQQSYAASTRGFYETLLPLAKSDKQKKILLGSIEHYKEIYLKKRLEVLTARAGIMSSFITGASKFPTKSNQKKMNRADALESKFIDWYDRAIPRAKQDILMAASDKEKEKMLWQKYQQKLIDDIAVIIAIDNGDMRGNDRSAFVNGAARTLRSIPSVALVRRALDFVEEQQQTMKKPVFTARHSVWKLVNEVTKNLEGEKIEEEDMVLKAFEGGEIRDAPSCDRIQIYFDDKPSEIVRKALKSSAWRWSPTNEVWQRKRTDNARVSAKRIIDEVYLPDRASKQDKPDEPNDNAISVMGLVQKKEEKKDDAPSVCAGLKQRKLDKHRPLSFKDRQIVLMSCLGEFIAELLNIQAMPDWEGMSDKEIKQLLEHTMSEGGGKVPPTEYYKETNPKGLRIWANFKGLSEMSDDDLIFSGIRTVRMVREMLKIPDPEQKQGDLFS